MQGGGTGWAGSGFLTCTACRAWDGMDDQGRQAIGCGWLPRLPGAQPIPTPFNGPDVTTCQGYLLSQPLVREALSAHLWWEKGQLRDLVEQGGGDPSPLLRFYVESVAGAIAELELEREAERERNRKR